MSDAAFLYYLPLSDQVVQASSDAHCLHLSVAEERAVGSFFFRRDKIQRVLSRALLRRALAEFTGLHPADWQFRKNSYGRPEIDAPRHCRSLKFNVSHTDGLVACLLSWDRQVGLDVEPIQDVAGLLSVARQYFADCEIDLIRSSPASEQSRVFLELWTLKESYFKARGLGLSGKLSDIAFTIKHHADYQISATMAPKLLDDPARWQFDLSHLCGHLVATTIERPRQLTVEVVMREATELMQLSCSS
jgi:4'-phosphopantetheinyl transferase